MSCSGSLGNESFRRRALRRRRNEAHAGTANCRGGESHAPRRQALADPRLIEALGALTSSLHKEASLSPFGRLAAGWDLKRMLSTLLILTDAVREDGTILTRPLKAPIFIAGLPRSGRTCLHGLLAEDPANRALRIWEAIDPYPKHRSAEFGAGRRKVQPQLGIFNRLSPGIRNLHLIEAVTPEECIEFTSQVFRSPRFDDVYRAPSYRAWLDASGCDDGYRFLARYPPSSSGTGGSAATLDSEIA